MSKFDVNGYYVFTILVIAAGGIPKGMNRYLFFVIFNSDTMFPTFVLQAMMKVDSVPPPA